MKTFKVKNYKGNLVESLKKFSDSHKGMKIVEACEDGDMLKIKTESKTYPEKFTSKASRELKNQLEDEWHIHGSQSIVRIDEPWKEKINGIEYKLYEVDQGRADHNAVVISKDGWFYAMTDKDGYIIWYCDLEENDINSISDLLEKAKQNKWKFRKINYME